MNSAHDKILDQFASDDGPDTRLATWYAQGQSDALGDRLLMFDNTNLPSWEILRFKPALAQDSRFESALRARVERLIAFQHTSFPIVRPIKRLGHDDGLAVVSTYSSGAPLADALKRPRSADFALRMIRQLVPALSALHRHDSSLSHGAITVDRIVLSTEGRLMMREHMVGSAIESLELTAARLWSDFGILVPPTEAASVSLDQSCDVAQLALIAVSLMAGRRLGPEDCSGKLPDVLDEMARRQPAHWVARFGTFRQWLERALQLRDERFQSGADAEAALAELVDEPSRPPSQPEPATQAAPREAPSRADQAPRWSPPRGLPPPVEAAAAAPPRASRGARHRVAHLWSRIPPSVIRSATVILCVVALAEAIVIGRLLLARAGTAAGESGAVADARPAVPPPRSEPAPIEPLSTSPPVVATAAAAVEPNAVAARPLPPPAAVRSGGFRVSSPVEIHVLEGERVIGSSVNGPIMASAGRHEFDFVNSVIGYRVRRTVDVKAGQITSLAVPVPNGTLNVNADPWAAVFIDGMPVGETPLGNLSIVPGEHEILFRHPQLGERRQRTIVRSDTETRVSVNMQQ